MKRGILAWSVAVALTAGAEHALRGWMIAREAGAAALSPHADQALPAVIQVAALLLRAALIAEGAGGAILVGVWLGRRIAPEERA